MFLTALPWEMSRSIIAAIADFMFICVVCACMLQVCPALSLRPLPAFMFVLFCLCLGQRACSGVGNVPLYHCGRCRLYVCLCCVVCLWGCALQVVSHSIIVAIAGFMLCFVCVVCLWAVRAAVSWSIIAAIAELLYSPSFCRPFANCSELLLHENGMPKGVFSSSSP